jgi:septal ring-binding cell division protein DamX
MDEKSNLYVFEKKEVFLLFLFMILIALTSFVLGVKMGKSYSYKSAGLTIEDRANVDLLSGQEEDVNKVLETTKKVDDDQLRKQMHESLKKKIMDEMSNDQVKPDSTAVPVATPVPESVTTTPKIDNQAAVDKTESINQKDQFTGKFTIQLSSHRSKAEAAEFSSGFTVRGYDPIVNEVELKGKGIWYRVSLGVFDSVSEAKEFIIKEKELFQGQDYVIGRFD